MKSLRSSFMLIEMVSISVLDWITAFTPVGFSNSCLRPQPPLLCRDRSLKGVTSLDISLTAVSLQVSHFVLFFMWHQKTHELSFGHRFSDKPSHPPFNWVMCFFLTNLIKYPKYNLNDSFLIGCRKLCTHLEESNTVEAWFSGQR